MYRRPNHILHAILSVLTGGIWLIPWAVIALRDRKLRALYEAGVQEARLQHFERGTTGQGAPEPR